MPLLGALLAAMFGKFFTAWADTLTRKAAIIVAAVASITTVTVAFVAAAAAAVSAILPSLPPVASTGIWLFVPYNAIPCCGVMFAVDAMCGVYAWTRGNVKLAAQVAG